MSYDETRGRETASGPFARAARGLERCHSLFTRLAMAAGPFIVCLAGLRGSMSEPNAQLFATGLIVFMCAVLNGEPETRTRPRSFVSLACNLGGVTFSSVAAGLTSDAAIQSSAALLAVIAATQIPQLFRAHSP